MKIGTNLSKKEVLDFENAGFRLPQRTPISPRRLFGDQGNSVDMSLYLTPDSPDEYPETRSRKTIRRNMKAPTTKHQNNSASAITLRCRIQQVTMIPHPGFGCIVTLESGVVPNSNRYILSTSSFPECSCPYFKEMLAKSLGKRGQWTQCKHLYYVFMITCNLDSREHVFMHAPSFSFNEVKLVLESGILKHLSSS